MMHLIDIFMKKMKMLLKCISSLKALGPFVSNLLTQVSDKKYQMPLKRKLNFNMMLERKVMSDLRK
jgi:hypothetical protein